MQQERYNHKVIHSATKKENPFHCTASERNQMHWSKISMYMTNSKVKGCLLTVTKETTNE